MRFLLPSPLLVCGQFVLKVVGLWRLDVLRCLWFWFPLCWQLLLLFAVVSVGVVGCLLFLSVVLLLLHLVSLEMFLEMGRLIGPFPGRHGDGSGEATFLHVSG